MGKTCESTLHTQGFRTHVVVGEEVANFCCFCSKVVPNEETQVKPREDDVLLLKTLYCSSGGVFASRVCNNITSSLLYVTGL
jgi:hypothetical protein